tara:strand:- start:9956 stop:10258 length:303 start_codon:yes stop_codon:yes gene_type:complete
MNYDKFGALEKLCFEVDYVKENIEMVINNVELKNIYNELINNFIESSHEYTHQGSCTYKRLLREERIGDIFSKIMRIFNNDTIITFKNWKTEYGIRVYVV